MSQVEIKVTIDTANTEQLAAAMQLLQSLGNVVELPKAETPKKEEPAKKQTTKKETPKKEEAPKAETKKEEPKEEPKKETHKKEESGIKIEDVRALLAKKVNDNRAEIKAKLTELGANNVTSLDSSKYQEFTDFLNEL
jgi:chromatin remodeling complex protein RSC6